MGNSSSSSCVVVDGRIRLEAGALGGGRTMALVRAEKAPGWQERPVHHTVRPPASWSVGGVSWTKCPPRPGSPAPQSPRPCAAGLRSHGPVHGRLPRATLCPLSSVPQPPRLVPRHPRPGAQPRLGAGRGGPGGRAEQDGPGRWSGPCGGCWGTFPGQKSHPSLRAGFRAALGWRAAASGLFL